MQWIFLRVEWEEPFFNFGLTFIFYSSRKSNIFFQFVPLTILQKCSLDLNFFHYSFFTVPWQRFKHFLTRCYTSCSKFRALTLDLILARFLRVNIWNIIHCVYEYAVYSFSFYLGYNWFRAEMVKIIINR